MPTSTYLHVVILDAGAVVGVVMQLILALAARANLQCHIALVSAVLVGEARHQHVKLERLRRNELRAECDRLGGEIEAQSGAGAIVARVVNHEARNLDATDGFSLESTI